MALFTTVAAVFPPEDFGLRLGADKTSQIPLQMLFPATSSVPAMGSLSTTILTYDYAVLAAGFLAPSPLTLTIQPYLDDGALIATGAPVTVSGPTGAIETSRGLVFRSAVITVANAGGSPVVLTNLIAVARSTN